MYFIYYIFLRYNLCYGSFEIQVFKGFLYIFVANTWRFYSDLFGQSHNEKMYKTDLFYYYYRIREKERKGGRERDSDRQTDTQREREGERDREREIVTDRQTDRQTD